MVGNENETDGKQIVRLDERSGDHDRRIKDLEACYRELKLDFVEVKSSQTLVLQMITDGKRVLGWVLAPVIGSLSLALLITAVLLLAKKGSW